MRLLQTESWKLFVIVLAPAILAEIIFLIDQHLLSGNNIVFVLSQVFRFIFLCTFVYWIFMLTGNLTQLYPNEDIRLATVTICLALLTLYRIIIDANFLFNYLKTGTLVYVGKYEWMIPFHLLVLICLLYCFYFIASLMVSAEVKKRASFKDFWKTFLLLIVFPVGLWFIQPRIKRLFS